MKHRRLRTVAAWNMKVGRGSAAIRGLRALIRDTRADGVLLQEAKNYVPAIRLAFPGWRVFGGPGFIASSNCVVMVRRTVKRGKRGKVRNRQAWTFMHRGNPVVHEGRVWRWMQVDGVYLLSMHRATNALGDNARAGREEADNLIDWFDDHHGPMLAAGDWNNRPADLRENSPADVAKHVRGLLLTPLNADIDFALIRDLRASAHRGKDYGSDHHAHCYSIKGA